MTEHDDVVCEKRPGRGHEWYIRTSDRLPFCRDCGYGWKEPTLSCGHPGLPTDNYCGYCGRQVQHIDGTGSAP